MILSEGLNRGAPPVLRAAVRLHIMAGILMILALGGSRNAAGAPFAPPALAADLRLQACDNCAADTSEPDDTRSQASGLPIGQIGQLHNFHASDDLDWYRIDNLTAGWSYNISTSDLTGGADTYMILYDRDSMIVKANDDRDTALCPTLRQFCASSLSWVASYPGPYLLAVRTLTYPDEQDPTCPCPGYSISGKRLRMGMPYVPAPPAETPAPTPTATPPPTPTPTPEPPVEAPARIPGLQHPKDIAIDRTTHRVYVTSRDNDRLYIIDGEALRIVDTVKVGDEPWGVAVNPATRKLYVAHYASGDLWVIDTTTLIVLEILRLGGHPTFVKINEDTDKIVVALHGNGHVAVIDGKTDTLERYSPAGGAGPWGLALNPHLNHVYVGTRDSGTVQVLDANSNFSLTSAKIKPCGSAGSAPYAMAFNPANNKLYIACSPFHNVRAVAIYQAAANGALVRLAFVAMDEGGEDGGGGVVVNPATDSAFITNSLANTVSVIGGSTDTVLSTLPVSANPFGIAVDGTTGRVFVANRDSSDVFVFIDPTTPIRCKSGVRAPPSRNF